MLQFGARQVVVACKLTVQKADGTRSVPATMGTLVPDGTRSVPATMGTLVADGTRSVPATLGAFTTFRSVDYHQVEDAGSMVVRS
jgi:hypothetical protein